MAQQQTFDYEISLPSYLQPKRFLTKWKDIETRTRNGQSFKSIKNWWFKFEQTENLHLAFHRFLPESEQKKERDEDKKKFLKAVVLLGNSLDAESVKAVRVRQGDAVASLINAGLKNDSFALDTEWRLVVGLGSESVIETSMSLHPLYGFPFIPSSAVKGIARAYALFAMNLACDEDDKELNPAPNVTIDDTAKRVFGTQNQVGEVIFFDGLPDEFPRLDVDLINPHYGEYYMATGTVPPPGDWMSPVPTFFLAVAPEQKFHFYLASRDQTLLDKAKVWLKEGLTQLGIGGKTSAGYGYFKSQDAEVADHSNGEKNGSTNLRKPTVPQNAVVAEVVNVGEKWVDVQIQSVDALVRCTNLTPSGLGLKPGSTIYVELKRDKKKRIISSSYRGMPKA